MATQTIDTRTFDRISRGFDAIASRSHSLHADCYRDPGFRDLERQQIFHKSWQFLCHEENLAKPGSYVATEIEGQSIFACRGQDSKLRAFYNVCKHRGHQLLQGSGQTKVITCPYHAWVYGLDGRLTRARRSELIENFDTQKICLDAVRVEVFCHLVFINLDPDAPEFALRITMLPLVDAVPSPLCTLRAPPVVAVLRPDSTLMAPPDPLVPLPAVTPKVPPQPKVATPVPKETHPLFAPFDVPELNLSWPLNPVVPALAETTEMLPLLLVLLLAAHIARAPPDCTGFRPEESDAAPPRPLVPLPTQKEQWPLQPPVAELEPKCIRIICHPLLAGQLLLAHRQRGIL